MVVILGARCLHNQVYQDLWTAGGQPQLAPVAVSGVSDLVNDAGRLRAITPCRIWLSTPFHAISRTTPAMLDLINPSISKYVFFIDDVERT